MLGRIYLQLKTSANSPGPTKITGFKKVPTEGRARQEGFIDSLSPCVSPLNPFSRSALGRLEIRRTHAQFDVGIQQVA